MTRSVCTHHSPHSRCACAPTTISSLPQCEPLRGKTHILPRRARWVNRTAASTVSRVGDLASSRSDAEKPSIRTLLSSPFNSGDVYLAMMAIAFASSLELYFLVRLSSSKGYDGWDCSKRLIAQQLCLDLCDAHDDLTHPRIQMLTVMLAPVPTRNQQSLL